MVGSCTDIHVRRGGNMFHINCEVLNLLCCICLLCVYSPDLPCFDVKFRIDWKFWNMCSRCQRF